MESPEDALPIHNLADDKEILRHPEWHEERLNQE